MEYHPHAQKHHEITDENVSQRSSRMNNGAGFAHDSIQSNMSLKKKSVGCMFIISSKTDGSQLQKECWSWSTLNGAEHPNRADNSTISHEQKIKIKLRTLKLECEVYSLLLARHTQALSNEGISLLRSRYGVSIRCTWTRIWLLNERVDVLSFQLSVNRTVKYLCPMQ